MILADTSEVWGMATISTRNMGERYPSSPQSTPSPDSRVNFKDAPCKGDEEERRKYLTAKYGSHQMRLIRKRLAVEDWLDKELRKLYDTVSQKQFMI